MLCRQSRTGEKLFRKRKTVHTVLGDSSLRRDSFMPSPNIVSSGQAIVTISGRDHYLGPHGTKVNKSLYDRLVAEFLSAGRQLVEPARAPSITVVEILAAFWRHCKTYYVKDGKPTNEQDAFRLIIRDVRHLYGQTAAIEFGPKAHKAVRQRLLNQRRDENLNTPIIAARTGPLLLCFFASCDFVLRLGGRRVETDSRWTLQDG